MKIGTKILYGEVTPTEYSRIPHMVCLADFNTSHPNPNRINRIAGEIDEYLRHKCKNAEVHKRGGAL